MDNFGEWDQSDDLPDFDPDLLENVDSWAVDHNEHEPVNMNDHHHINENDPRRSHLHSHQWTDLGVPDFHEDYTNNAVATSGKSTNSSNIKTFNDQVTSDEVAVSTETVEAAVEAAVAAISETSDSVTSGCRSANGTTPGSSENSSSSRERITQHYLHPLGIQSSASCPDHTIMQGNYTGDYGYTQHQYSTMPVPIPKQHDHQELCSVDLSKALERSVAAPFTTTNGPHNSTSASNQHISSLAANFMLAQSGNSSVVAAAAVTAHTGGGSIPSVTATNAVVTQQQQPCTITSSSNSKTIVTSLNNKRNKIKKKGRAPRQSKTKSSTKRRKKSDSTSATAVSSLPPFYLFDAPVELRANFMQNQRRLGLPIQNDPNSYHYGETVNGFHPHQYQLPVGTTASTSTTTSGGLPSSIGAGSTATATGSPKHVPKLIDARHGNSTRRNKGGVKNEREQKRALKITELIEQLRLQMEDGGWQVEARSKFHTLHNCAEYVNHMIAFTSEKEKKNEKLKSDLDEKRRQIERENEDKAMQEGRSDPESVTSCLTSDTTLCSLRYKEAEERNGGGGNNSSNNKRKLSIDNRDGGSPRDTNDNRYCMISSEATSEESSVEEREGSSGSGSGDGGPNVHGCSISKTISTVSDMTDSNRGSSSNSSGSGGGSSDDVPTEQDSPSGNYDDEDQPSTGSISSDAAVVGEKTSRDRHSCHKDVVFINDKWMSRQKRLEEVTSLERSFELNYEEVFNKSNIPQLIANTSGKIVTWNECFAKATGYRQSEIERMTIFSLVKPENLANFFEIVAAALRPSDEDTEINNEEKNQSRTMTEEQSKKNLCEKDDNEPTKSAVSSSLGGDECATTTTTTTTTTTVNGCSKEKEDEEGGNPMKDDNSNNVEEEIIMKVEGKLRGDDFKKCAKEETQKIQKEECEAMPEHLLDYTAMTLPCIDFPAMIKRNQAAADSDTDAIPPLHLTVTLMADKDPKKRCFHCVFTNSKGTNGSLGIITPELLASLFSTPYRRRKRHHSTHGRQRKRARGSNERHSVKERSNKQPETPPSPLLMPPPHCGVQMNEEDSLKTTESEDVETETLINDIYI